MKEADFFFGARGAQGNQLAGRFARYLKKNPEKKREYEATRGNAAKAQFRKDWCVQKFEEYKESETLQKSFTHEDTKSCRLFSLARIAVEEGGSNRKSPNILV